MALLLSIMFSTPHLLHVQNHLCAISDQMPLLYISAFHSACVSPPSLYYMQLHNLMGLSAVTPISKTCQNYLHIAQCLSLYSPCNGSAWCGSVSLDDLTAAICTACQWNNTIDSATICSIGTLTNVPTIRNYCQGSSSTGWVDSAMLTCQDVAVGKRWHLHDIHHALVSMFTLLLKYFIIYCYNNW